MDFFKTVKVLVIFFAVLPSIRVHALPPSVTGVSLSGVMKVSHTLTVNYTYVPNPDPESGTLIEWIRYADNCGSSPTVIATGSSYTITAANEGFHIGVRVTPRDNTGTTGTPVTFQPWNCLVSSPSINQGPNPVLQNSSLDPCKKADLIGVPVPGNQQLFPTFYCSPRSLTWQVDFTGINYRLPDFPARIIIVWGDGRTETVAPTLQNPLETNMAKQTWRVEVPHVFDYDAGSTASTTVNGRCTYTMRTTWGIGTYTGTGFGTVTSCISQGEQTQLFTVWDTEDNTTLGTLDVEHVTGTAGIQATPPAPLPASNENVNVCHGDTDPVRLQDNSDFNCTAPLETFQQNDQPRWIQWVYGTTGSTITTGAGATEKIIIDGVSYEASDLPVYGKVLYQPATTVNPAPAITDNIQMPTSAVVGQQFFVTMRSWNICNVFDRVTIDGGYNPNQGAPFDVFDIRGPGGNFQNQPEITAVTAPYYANSTPVTRGYTITITDKPDKPIAADESVCNSSENSTLARTISVSPTVAGLTYRWYASLTDALSNSGLLSMGADYVTSAANPAGGVGVHDYFVTAFAANGCVSDPDTVYFTRRASIGTINITGPADVCPGGTYTYRASPFNHATPLTPGGATEYFWLSPPGGPSIRDRAQEKYPLHRMASWELQTSRSLSDIQQP
jgi:hypothetical protein